MELFINNETSYNLTEDLIDLIKNVISKTLDYENFEKNVEISFTIVSNEEIKKLNFEYRGIDKETDVLSFPLLSFPLEKDFFKNKRYIPLGDIVVSIEKALNQANEYGHSIERELAFLTVHSMLHLLGYDHIEEYGEKIMFEKQELILNILNITR